MKTKIKARVERFELSGHADREELLQFAVQTGARSIVLTHGDPAAREWFAQQLADPPSLGQGDRPRAAQAIPRLISGVAALFSHCCLGGRSRGRRSQTQIPVSLICKIDECSFREGKIHLRGWCFENRLPISKVEAVFPEPLSTVPLRGFGLPSPDVAALVDPSADRCRFDETIDPPSPGAAGDFRLQFTLGDGTIVLGESIQHYSNRAEPTVHPTGTEGSAEAGAPRSAAEIRAEIDAVNRRDAAFRANMVQEFLDRGEGNTYLHTLRSELAALTSQGQETSAQIESLVRRLEAEEDKAAALQGELASIRSSAAWRFLAPARAGGQPENHGSR